MPWDKLRAKAHGLLWFGTDENESDRWSITDPTSSELNEACQRLRPDNLYVGGTYTGGTLSDEERRRRADLYLVLRCVEDYQHLTTYTLGVEHIIKKLRAIWRALR